jgi:hypothetical protein
VATMQKYFCRPSSSTARETTNLSCKLVDLNATYLASLKGNFGKAGQSTDAIDAKPTATCSRRLQSYESLTQGTPKVRRRPIYAKDVVLNEHIHEVFLL